MKTPTFCFHSFGCRVNQAEIEAISQNLIKEGFLYSEANPDIFIINTCAVTAKAEREARQYIFQVKKRCPKTKLIVTGCSVTYWKKNNLYKDLPVDLYVVNNQKENLLSIISNFIHKQNHLPSNPANKVVDKYLSSGRVIIKIQDGCQRFCSYCIVPYLRGKPKSKRIKDVMKTIRFRVGNIIKEVILTAINTEAYGVDTGETLSQLIQTILTASTVSRLSFGSINPWSLNEDFFKLYIKLAGSERLIDFFHIPLQSGSNKILKLMRREYTTKEYLDKICRIKKINPLAFIATDVIVGFFDETDKDFKDTYKFLEKAPIDRFHVFRFSKRLNTAAYYMSGKYNEPLDRIKKVRSEALIDLSNKKYRWFLQTLIGKSFSALFIGKPFRGYQSALLDNQILVNINVKNDLLGTIKKIKILRLNQSKLFGSLCGRYRT